MNLREVNMKYCFLVVLIRHDYAEIWGFRFGLTLCIAALKTMASTGVLIGVFFAFKRPVSCDPQIQSVILT